MSEEKKFETLEDVVRVVKPKSIQVLLEVEHDFTYGNTDRDCHNVQRIEDILDRLEDCPESLHAETDNALVFRQPVIEGNATIIPVYGIIGTKEAWSNLLSRDLTFIYRLDGRIEIVRVNGDNKDKGPLPYTLVK